MRKESSDGNYAVIFTRTEGLTNSPVQGLKWSHDQPCAYTDQYFWLESSSQAERFVHEAEIVAFRDAC